MAASTLMVLLPSVDLMDAAVDLSFRCLDSFTITAKLLNGVEMQPIVTEVFNLKHLMDMCIKTCMLSGGTSPTVKYCSSIAPNVCETIRTSREHVMRNLLNLLSNAARFTEVGSIQVIATLSDNTHSQHAQCKHTQLDATLQLKIAVIDTGHGVTLEDHERIWNPFVSLAKRGQQHLGQQHLNSGLGLFVVKKQCEAIGGDCGMEQMPSQGSKFWFSVPYDPTSSCDPYDPATELLSNDTSLTVHRAPYSSDHTEIELKQSPLLSQLDQPAAESKLPHILLIDDTQSVLQLAAMMLRQEMYTVTTVGGPNEGLDAMKAQIYDLVLCDYRMPGLSGSQLTATFREWELASRKDKRKQVIWALTAYKSESMEKECIDAGMQGVLTKPLEVEDAQTILRNIRNSKDISRRVQH